MKLPPRIRTLANQPTATDKMLMLGAGAVLAGSAAIWAWRKLSPRLIVAPGWPGKTPRWTPSAEQGVGTALDVQSNLWFTLYHGILTEVFFPRADQPAIAQMGLIVTARDGFYSKEKDDTQHVVKYVHDGVPVYRLTNTCRGGRYLIEKTVFSHPASPVVLQRTRFVPLVGKLEDYRIYVLAEPHLGNHGWHNNAWVGDYEGHAMLFAEEDDHCAALGVSSPWKSLSAGYAGVSDGRRQLRRRGRLRQTYLRAPRGDVSLIGEIDLSAGSGEFVIALGFGGAWHEAGLRVRRALLADIDSLQELFVGQWLDWQSTLKQLQAPPKSSRDLYRTSTMVLRTHEDKAVPGAFVASLSIPWGGARGTDDHFGPVGYHVLWPRDLYMIAGGLLAAGDGEAARRALEYCQATQQADGGWPQNQAVNGRAVWTGKQLGETALPVLLFDLLNRAGLLSAADRKRIWPMARAAAAHIVREGPSAQQDRWENARGFTPFTLASTIAALLTAAELADDQGQNEVAQFFRETADAWHGDLDYWTYVHDTPLAREVGVPGYYLRVAPPDRHGEPVKYRGHSELWYRPSRDQDRPPADIVSVDALAYVRFGLRAPDDPRILDTVKVIDALLKTQTPYGPCWHRYNRDGYGEKEDGSPFDGRRGVGRLWPLLTGERAHYELLAGRPDEARRLLQAMEEFAGDGKMLPEQIWDTDDIPSRELYFGRPSGSAMPLAWTHAEYIKLRRSLVEGRVFDLPQQTWQRYVVDDVRSRHVLWRINHRRRVIPTGKILRVLLTNNAHISVSFGGLQPTERIQTRDTGLGLFYADLPTDELTAGESIRFCFDWPKLKKVGRREWYMVRCDELRIETPEQMFLSKEL